MTIPFSPPRIDNNIKNEVLDTLSSGWLTTGPKTKQLEKEVEVLSETPKVLCVNSCTAGMELMLRWLGVGAGDEVIVPAYTYCATANIVLHVGAKPVMVDINADDFTININKIKDAITEKTKVIIPVDLGGMPIDYQALNNLVRGPNIVKKFKSINEVQAKFGRIVIMTDAAHSLGSIYQGKSAACFSDITVYSFHAVKNLTTVEGGAICLNVQEYFNCNELYSRLNKLTVHGQSKDALAKFGKNSWEYDVEEAGYKLNMPDVLASIGLVEIKRYKEDVLKKRKEIFDLYTERLSQYDWAELPVYLTQQRKSSFHLYLLRIKDISMTIRNAIIQRIFNNGVSVNVHYKPLPELTLYKTLGYKIEDYPISLDSYHREITLPVYYDLSLDNVDKVLDVLIEAVEYYNNLMVSE